MLRMASAVVVTFEESAKVILIRISFVDSIGPRLSFKLELLFLLPI